MRCCRRQRLSGPPNTVGASVQAHGQMRPSRARFLTAQRAPTAQAAPRARARRATRCCQWPRRGGQRGSRRRGVRLRRSRFCASRTGSLEPRSAAIAGRRSRGSRGPGWVRVLFWRVAK
eukprot:5919048-Lingulodinium_polyedra.AAC.1